MRLEAHRPQPQQQHQRLPDGNANGHTNGNTASYAYSNSDCHSAAYANPDGHSASNSNSDAGADSNAVPTAYSRA